MAPKRGESAKPLLVFDLDGVLVDVTASFRTAVRRTVGALGGGRVTQAEIQALKNAGGYNNDWDLSRELLRRRGLAVERAQVIETFNRFYLGNGGGEGLIRRERWLLPRRELAALRRRYRLAIFTGRPRADAGFTLRHFGVAGAFETVVALEDVTEPKPAPEGLERLRRAHAPAPLAAYVGDTVDDARCAATAGVPFIGILAPRLHHRSQLAALFGETGNVGVAPDVTAAIRMFLPSAGSRRGNLKATAASRFR
ncbi:MAG: HAD family hydrolase [Terriglobales bacterium]